MNTDPNPPAGAAAWFCVRAQPKHEHIAARHLQAFAEVEVFLPRVRFRRATRRGAVWSTEALFPNYLFARFDWKTMLRRVQSAPGVGGVIHFGTRWPTIPDETMAELRQAFGTNQIHQMEEPPAVGDAVRLTGGIFHGLHAVITQLMPGRERVRVLLDFLGRQTTVEVQTRTVIKNADERRMVR